MTCFRISQRGSRRRGCSAWLIRISKSSNSDVDVSEEAVNDRAKLLLHRLVARRLACEPGLIEAARSRLDPSVGAPDHVCEWDELLRLEPGLIRRALVSRSERMIRLRLSSPFYAVSGFQDPAFRKRVWRLARRGSGVAANHEAAPETPGWSSK